MSKLVVVLSVVLAIVLIALAVVLALFFSQQRADTESASNAVGSSSPSPIASLEIASGPTPYVTTDDGLELPGLVAAIHVCDSIFPDENMWAIIKPALYELDLENRPTAIEVRGADSAVAEDIRAGELPGGDPLQMHACVLDTLGAPGGLVERMRNTRALDGTQGDTWSGYRATWIYHPDSGLDAVFSYDE